MAAQLRPSIYPNSFFSRPLPKAKGAATADEICLAVGRALTRWELLETELANLLAILVDAKSPAARRVYGSIFSSSSRRDAVRLAAEAFFAIHHVQSDFDPVLRELLEHHARASKWRDEIAHGVAHGWVIDQDNKGVFLMPAAYISAHNTLYPNRSWASEQPETIWTERYRYVPEDIEAFGMKCWRLQNRFIELRIALARIVEPALYAGHPDPFKIED